MGKVFVCSKCNEVVESQFLKKGEIYIHKRCGGETDVPSESLDKSVVIRIQKEHEKWKLREEKNKWEKEQEKLKLKEEKKKELENRTLTEKYDFLTLFQYLVGISMIIYTIFFIITIGESFDLAKRMDDYTLFFTSIISYSLVLFNSICVISIVNFLFNLDNNKSDKK